MEILNISCLNEETGKQQTFIRKPPIRIGRKNSAMKLDIELDTGYRKISRSHATIDLKAGQLTLKDHSSNGTLINDQKIHQIAQLLRQGDSFVIQPYKFVIQYSVR